MAGERGLYRSVCRGLGEAIVVVLFRPLCKRLKMPMESGIPDWCLSVAASRRTTADWITEKHGSKYSTLARRSCWQGKDKIALVGFS